MKVLSPLTAASALNRCLSVASLSVALTSLMAGPTARADERLFTYNYEAEVLPKHGLEFEQWITHKRGKDGGVFSRWDFREELEYGLTERLTTAGYLNLRNIHSDGVPGLANKDTFQFKGISSEWKYQLLNPQTQPLGALIYGEATYNGEEFELEEKLVMQKNLGEKWVLVLNATVEQEWEFAAAQTQRELSLELTTGIAYKLTPHWAAGFEALHARTFPDFASEKTAAYFVGPALHYGTGKWWATLTVLPQVSGRPATRSGLNLNERERIEVRLIAGINF